MRHLSKAAAACALALIAASPAAAQLRVRVKDITRIKEVRPNQLYGIGIVVGLNGTGDDSRFSRQLLTNALNRVNVNIPSDQITAKNVAVVMLTAEIHPFMQVGDRLDVNVASMGDSSSLQGGILLQAPLRAANGQIYAAAQGSVVLGGFAASGAAASVQKNHPTSGRIPNGAILERKVSMLLPTDGSLDLVLKQPDFATAQRVAEALNAAFPACAAAEDAAVIRVQVPREYAAPDRLTPFVARIHELQLTPDSVARVVINERTGTVIVGENVQIARVAITHGSLTISIKETETTSQPGAFSPGQTTKEKSTDIAAVEGKGNMIVLRESVEIADIAKAMTMLGVSPRDMVAIFQALKEAGALKGDLVIM